MNTELFTHLPKKDVEDKYHNTHRLYIFSRPNEPREDLIEPLSRLTAAGFMRPLDDGLRADVAHHILGSERLMLATYGDEPSAFLASTLRKGPKNESILHIEGIIVDGAFCDSGLAKQMLVAEIGLTGSEFAACHTQSNSMKRLMEKIADCNVGHAAYIAPSLPNTRLRGDVDKGRYGNGYLYGSPQRFAPLAIQAYGFNASKGDAMVIAGHIKSEHIPSYIKTFI